MLLYISLFFVSLLYSSVGHGGASGYLAVLMLFSFAPEKMKASALVLNLLVSGIGWFTFNRARYFSWRLILPFIITSIPFAFIGGYVKISSHLYYLLLAIALVFASWRLFMKDSKPSDRHEIKQPAWGTASLTGSGLGLLSGFVGVGGGIFLSPILILLNWADTKSTAAASAAFIFFNSVAGLLGQFAGKHMDIDLVTMGPFVLVTVLGGLAGSYLGAWKLSPLWLRRLLGLVLLLASFKLFRMSFSQLNHQ